MADTWTWPETGDLIERTVKEYAVSRFYRYQNTQWASSSAASPRCGYVMSEQLAVYNGLAWF
jgi:hypothetical protein